MIRKKKYRSKNKRWAFVMPFIAVMAIGAVMIFSSMYEKSWLFNWNGIRAEIKDSVQTAEYWGISSGIVRDSGVKPKQFDRRHWIMKNATIQELLKLTEYPEGTIRVIAYEGLIRKPDFKNKSSLALRAIKDRDYRIEFYSGCQGMDMYIGEYLIEFVLYIDDNSPPPIEGRNPFRFKQNEIDYLLAEYRKTPNSWKK